MKILDLKLINFRNYENLNFEVKSNLNLFFGKNAAGKTNFLDSIYTLLNGKSFRNTKDTDNIMIDKDRSELFAKIENFSYEDNLEIQINRFDKNIYKINSEEKTLRNYKKDLSCVIFSPADINLVKQYPNYRRRYIDDLISIIDPVYEYNLSVYKKIIFQRNKLLKQNLSKDLLEVYNYQLAEYGSKILKKRINTLRKLEKYCINHFYRISGGDKFKITYLSTIPISKLDLDLSRLFLKKLDDAYEDDIAKKYTTIGIHRDDIDFKINNISSKLYASQGEIRTIILSLKLAEIDLIKENKKSEPILLLDDVFSELDKNRSSYLIKSIGDIQTFISSTDYDLESSNLLDGDFYEVKENRIISID